MYSTHLTANGCKFTIMKCAVLFYSSINSTKRNCIDEESETSETPES